MYEIICDDTEAALASLRTQGRTVDMVLSSPPYGIGKAYESFSPIDAFVAWQTDVLRGLTEVLKPGGSLVWQVGSHVHKGEVTPLDLVILPAMFELGLSLRNRYIWHFGHGLHARKRFSGRHETVLWLTKGPEYFRDPSVLLAAGEEMPGEEAGISPVVRRAMESGVWEIGAVKNNHPERTGLHPCQFPVGLAERAILGLSRPGETILDPFCGVGSAGVAAIAHSRSFLGIDRDPSYCAAARSRLEGVALGQTRWHSHEREPVRPKSAEPAMEP